MKRNAMITFSGIDSSGKSTYIDFLKSHFDEMDIKYKVVWSRGGYTNTFEIIKKIVRLIAKKKLPKSGHSKQRDEMFQKKSVSNLWYVIGMLDLIRLYAITFRLYRLLGYTLICDRYIWDTYVDFTLQFSEEKLNKSILWKILEKTSRKPNVSFFFYISADESLRRSIIKNEAYAESLDQRKKRIDIYQNLNRKGFWSNSISTEEKPIENTWSGIKGVIEDALR